MSRVREPSGFASSAPAAESGEEQTAEEQPAAEQTAEETVVRISVLQEMDGGVAETDSALVTAEEARLLRDTGKCPGPGAVLTPLAREILDGQ